MTAEPVLEEKEKKKRKLNLHHIPESNLVEPQDRQKEDIDNLTVLFNKYEFLLPMQYELANSTTTKNEQAITYRTSWIKQIQ